MVVCTLCRPSAQWWEGDWWYLWLRLLPPEGNQLVRNCGKLHISCCWCSCICVVHWKLQDIIRLYEEQAGYVPGLKQHVGPELYFDSTYPCQTHIVSFTTIQPVFGRSVILRGLNWRHILCKAQCLRTRLSFSSYLSKFVVFPRFID